MSKPKRQSQQPAPLVSVAARVPPAVAAKIKRRARGAHPPQTVSYYISTILIRECGA